MTRSHLHDRLAASVLYEMLGNVSQAAFFAYCEASDGRRSFERENSAWNGRQLLADLDTIARLHTALRDAVEQYEREITP